MYRVIITDKLKSYGAAKREILPGVEHRQSRSHQPLREFASPHTPTRISYAGVQVGGACPALSVREVLLPNTSDHDGICCLRPITVES